LTEVEHALDIAVDDRRTDTGDYPDLDFHALSGWGPRGGPSRRKAASAEVA